MSELKRRTGDIPDPTPETPPPPEPNLLDRPTREPPAEPVAEDAPEGSWEGAGRYLSPELNALADRELAARREAEPAITEAMKRLETDLGNAELVGLEHVLKGEDRFKAKFATRLELNPDEPPESVATSLHDGIRYTLVFDDDHYAEGVRLSAEHLERAGYLHHRTEPRWDDAFYRGTNSRWQDPVSSQMFEVQFHTPASLEAKERTHETYELLSNPRISPEETARLAAFQREVTAAVPVPPGALEIEPYEKEA
jgi:hypothetical protein